MNRNNEIRTKVYNTLESASSLHMHRDCAIKGLL